MVLTARAKAHHHALELESFRTLPDFSLGGGWRFRTYDGGRDFFSLTVGVELPVWSRSVYGSETAAHREHIAVIEQERLALVREIQGRISVLLREIEMVDVEIEAIVEIERPALNETLAVLRAEYPTGDSEFSDLLRTELRLLELDLRKISLETRRDQLHQELRIESL
mgnify:CR=1 FL=1